MHWLLLAGIIAQPAQLAPFPSRPVEQPPALFDSVLPLPPQPATPAIAVPDAVVFPPLPTFYQDRWLAMDKFWHLSASFATVGASHHLCANRLHWNEPVPMSAALAGTFTLGLTKEFCDLAGPNKHFSWKDLTADLVGIGLGYLVFIHDFK